MNNITAKDFIKIYVELKYLTPNVKEWTEELFSESESRLIRLKQLHVFKRIFNINETWEEFERGKFLDRFPIESYNQLKQNFKTLKKTKSWNSQNFDHFCYRDIQLTFRLFLEFIVIENTLKNHINEYSMTYSLGQNYSYELTKSYFTQRTNKKIQYLINNLAIIIDPLNQVFSLDELKNKFNFPYGDLEDIDIENW
jgi:hypothetical protein